MRPRADYDRLSATYDEVRGEPAFLDAWTRRLADALAAAPGGLVLDAGCGTATYAARLARRSGARVVGLDLSRGMLAQAKRKDPALPLARGTALRLPFRDGSFDAAFAVFLLHHLTDWRDAVVEAARVLRPGGRFAVLTRSHEQLRESVMAKFPGVLDIDLARFPDLEDVREALRSSFASVDGHVLDKGPNRIPVEEWLRRARGDFISTLSLLPPREREAGLAEFERRLRAGGPHVEDRSTFTLLVARKG